jgi:hypothetical protein
MTGGIVTLKQQTPGHDRWYVPLDTAHCGVQTCLGEKGRVYDYLGLFWLPVRVDHPVSLVVKPAAVPPPAPQRQRMYATAPKPVFSRLSVSSSTPL